MFSRRRNNEIPIFPLKTAVFCLDCETIASSSGDECPVCGSRSLVSLARMLGGNLFRRGRNRVQASEDASLDATISLELHDVKTSDLNSAIDQLTQAIGALAKGSADIHVDVEPSDSSAILKKAA
jgi:hypothetical protein